MHVFIRARRFGLCRIGGFRLARSLRALCEQLTQPATSVHDGQYIKTQLSRSLVDPGGGWFDMCSPDVDESVIHSFFFLSCTFIWFR